jgi:hypothetical protein
MDFGEEGSDRRKSHGRGGVDSGGIHEEGPTEVEKSTSVGGGEGDEVRREGKVKEERKKKRRKRREEMKGERRGYEEDGEARRDWDR